MVTDVQVRKLMKELGQGVSISTAAAKAGMCEKTARKYRNSKKLPSQCKIPRNWRTRADPFTDVWEEISERLGKAPGLQAKTIFEHYQRQQPGRFHDGQLRTLQRRIRDWLALHGPPQEVFFAQEWEPGKYAQSDFTWMNKLVVTIQGEKFDHLLYHFVLPYSNWETGSICFSENFEALSRGFQDAVWELGHVPAEHQTDQSSAATHNLPKGGREFNERYAGLMRHYKVEPGTIQIGKPNQNGDIEQAHRRFKDRVDQMLQLRGSRDFASQEEYAAFLREIFVQANKGRQEALQRELEQMRGLPWTRLDDFKEEEVSVGQGSTIRVEHNTYSVASQLIGCTLRVRKYAEHLEIYYGDKLVHTIERQRGRFGHYINYRHVIWSLVRKPGAFPRYRYREDLFPTVVFRRAYDALREKHGERQADREYLHILYLAASTMESDVETALDLLLEAGHEPNLQAVKGLVETRAPSLPRIEQPEPNLLKYDQMLREVAAC